MGVWAKTRAIIWGEPPETKEEKVLLFKMDWFILSYLCLMYFSNYLDRANLSNAYVSGMKEALHMGGSDYNRVNSLFTSGYGTSRLSSRLHVTRTNISPSNSVVGMIPQNLLLHVIPARILFPANTLIWGCLTMVTAAAKNTHHLEVIRFFQGIAEASTFVGAHYIMGSWYKEHELGKRGAIFSSSAQIATIFSGVLQASIYNNLDGHAGLAGFQWLFIICGLITVPMAIYGYLLFPDTPQTTKAWWLTASERQLAIDRLPPKPVTKLDFTVFKRVLGHWRWYVMSIIWIIGGELESIGANAIMALWMKTQTVNGLPRWTVSDYNYYPAGGTAVAIAALLATAIWTDYTAKRYQVNILIAASIIISSAILLANPASTGAKFFAFYLSGVSYSGQASNFAWANDLTRGDDQERSIILASMNMWSNVFNAWWTLIFWRASDAPRWKRGYISMLVLSPLIVVMTCVAYVLQRRDERNKVEEVVGGSEVDAEMNTEAEKSKSGGEF